LKLRVLNHVVKTELKEIKRDMFSQVINHVVEPFEECIRWKKDVGYRDICSTKEMLSREIEFFTHTVKNLKEPFEVALIKLMIVVDELNRNRKLIEA
jgi:hypothetical protein